MIIPVEKYCSDDIKYSVTATFSDIRDLQRGHSTAAPVKTAPDALLEEESGYGRWPDTDDRLPEAKEVNPVLSLF
jgi:hypothetical protein